MVSRYEYAKDVRSDKEFEEYLIRGKYNQQLAIEQFVVDKYLDGYGNYGFEELEPEELARNRADWNYSPDYKLLTPKGNFYLEVKVQMRPLGKEIDFKTNQIHFLIKVGGFILYCLEKKWCIIKPDYISNYGDVVESNKLNKEKAYRIQTHNLNWTLWSHSPEFIGYDSKHSKK